MNKLVRKSINEECKKIFLNILELDEHTITSNPYAVTNKSISSDSGRSANGSRIK